MQKYSIRLLCNRAACTDALRNSCKGEKSTHPFLLHHFLPYSPLLPLPSHLAPFTFIPLSPLCPALSAAKRLPQIQVGGLGSAVSSPSWTPAAIILSRWNVTFSNNFDPPVNQNVVIEANQNFTFFPEKGKCPLFVHAGAHACVMLRLNSLLATYCKII